MNERTTPPGRTHSESAPARIRTLSARLREERLRAGHWMHRAFEVERQRDHAWSEADRAQRGIAVACLVAAAGGPVFAVINPDGLAIAIALLILLAIAVYAWGTR